MARAVGKRSDMRPMILSLLFTVLSGCQTTVQCSADEDCANLEYCYKLALDLENAEGTEPGFPYEEFGTCTSDCTSDSDCHGSARCTPKGICKDLSADNDRQWTGYEPSLEQLLTARRFAPLLNCQGFMFCILECESEPATCSDCVQGVDSSSQALARNLTDCMRDNCQNTSYSNCLNGPCVNEKLLCREDN
jgi:hypothetical protein